MSGFKIHNPHDSFFKHVLSHPTVAKDFLKAHLRPAITQCIPWDTLRLSNRSYTDERLKQLHSDLVYTCQIDEKDSYICILIEQQTTPERSLPFRFMQYNMAILTEHFAQNKKSNQYTTLPIILNICLYSGKKTPFPHSIDTRDGSVNPILAKDALSNPILLIDLGQMIEEEIKRHGTADLLELLLKQSRERTFLNWLKERPALVVRMMDDLFGIYGISSIIYILSVERKHSSEEILNAIRNIVPHKKREYHERSTTISTERYSTRYATR